MLEYEFLKCINEQIRIYKGFPLPTAVCDRSLRLYWCNDKAVELYPPMLGADGVRELLAEYHIVELLEQVDRNGSCMLTSRLPLSGVGVCLHPILQEGRAIGIVAILLASANTPPRQAALLPFRAAKALDANIRACTGTIFSAMDCAALKAEFLQAGWIKQSFNRIGSASYRIMRIAANIAQYARLCQGGTGRNMETVDVCDILYEMEKPASDLGRSMGIPITFCYPREPCLVSGDRQLLELALLNLLHNSLYFTRPENTVAVSVARDRNRIALTVRDSGVGIPEDHKEQVWRPYASYSHGGRGAGIGLGLAIVRLVAALHGGVAVLATSPRNTTVTLRLPAATLSSPLSLRQRDPASQLSERFSTLYTGLVDAQDSPFRQTE